MKCYCCPGRLKSKMTNVYGTLRGQPAMVRVEALVCDRCGLIVLTDLQSDAYNEAVMAQDKASPELDVYLESEKEK